MFYIVLALLFAIHHLGLPKIFVVIGCLGWGDGFERDWDF
jgi:hypothetical protein